MTNSIDVATATTKELLDFFNANSEKHVKRFSDRKTAERRVNELIASLPQEALPLEAEPEEVVEPQGKSPVRSAAMAQSWTDPVVAAKRATRHFVRVDGVEYCSVRAAFVALELPLNEHIKFRMELKAAGRLVHAYDRSWEAIENV